MRIIAKILVLVLALACPCIGTVWAAPTVIKSRGTEFEGRRITMQSVACPITSDTITIDGRLDEPAWRLAGKIVPELGVFSSATETARRNTIEDKTEVYIMADSRNLYFGIICHESTPDKIRIDKESPWATWNQDSIELYIDSNRDKNTYYHLMFTAGKGRFSELGDYAANKRKPLTKINWYWQTEIDVQGNAWYAEVKIPFNEIEMSGKKGSSFGFNIERKDMATDGEESPRSFWTDPKFAPELPPHANPAYYGLVSVGAACMVDAVGLGGQGIYGGSEIRLETGNYSREPTTVKLSAKLTLLAHEQVNPAKFEGVLLDTTKGHTLRYYRKWVDVPVHPETAYLFMYVDNRAWAFVNNTYAGAADLHGNKMRVDVTKMLKKGRNLVTVRLLNEGGAGYMGATLKVTDVRGRNYYFYTDETWETQAGMNPYAELKEYAKIPPWDGGGIDNDNWEEAWKFPETAKHKNFNSWRKRYVPFQTLISGETTTAVLKAKTRQVNSIDLPIPTAGKYILRVTATSDDGAVIYFTDTFDLTARYDMQYPFQLAAAGDADRLIRLLTEKKHPLLERNLILGLGQSKNPKKAIPILLKKLSEPRNDTVDPTSKDPNRKVYMDWKGEKPGPKFWNETEDEATGSILLSYTLTALGDIGVQEGDDRVFKAVRAILDDENSFARAVAVRALSKMGSKGLLVLAEIIEGQAMPKVCDDNILREAMRNQCMAALGDRTNDTNVHSYLLLAAKSSVRADVRAWAMRAAQRMKVTGREAAFLANLRHNDPMTAAQAAIAMAKEKNPDPKAIPGLIAACMAKLPEDVKDEAALMLTRFPAGNVNRYVGRLAEGIADADLAELETIEVVTRYLRGDAVKGVSRRDLMSRAEAINEEIFRTALRALGNLKSQSMSSQLIRHYIELDDGEYVKQGLIVRAIGAIGGGDEDTIGFLAGLLTDGGGEWIRDEACYALGRMDAQAVLPVLSKLAKDHTKVKYNNPGYYLAGVAKAKKQMGGPYGDPGAGFSVNLPTGLYISRYAVRAMGFVGTKGAALRAAKVANREDTPEHTRYEAARTVSLIGDKAIMASVRDHLSPWMTGKLADPDDVGRFLGVMDLKPGRKQDGGWTRPHYGITLNSLRTGFTGSPKVTKAICRVLGQAGLVNELDGRKGEAGIFKNQNGLLHIGMLNSYEQFHVLPDISQGYDSGFVAPVYAVRALGDNGDANAISTLQEWAKDINILVRYNAIEALGKLGDRSALDSLLVAWRNRHTAVAGEGWCIPADDAYQMRVKTNGQSWRHGGPSWDKWAAAEAMATVGGEIVIDRLREQLYQKIEIIKETNDIFHLADILWIGAALDQLGEDDDARTALRHGMKLFSHTRLDTPYSEKEMRFKESIFAAGKFGQNWAMPIIEDMMLHNWLTWKSKTYEPRELARDAWMRISKRKDRFSYHRATDYPWLW